MPSKEHDPAVEASLLTPQEVAELLRVDRQTVYRWLRQGDLQAIKIGGVWRVPREIITLHPLWRASQ